MLFTVVWILDSYVFKWTVFLNRLIAPLWRIPLGFILLILSGILTNRGLKTVFGEPQGEPGVLRTGVFAVVRHPVYLGELLVFTGFLCLSLSLAALMVWLGAILFMHYIARYEEQLLIERFGDAYRQYQQEVPMWLPAPARLIKQARLRRKCPH